MLISMPGICFSRDTSVDSLVLFRIWNYAKEHQLVTNGVQRNVYAACTFKTNRRNPTLFLVPTMYSIAKGERQFVVESYYKMKFRDAFQYDLSRQVFSSTIPHNRTVMPTMLQYMTPNLYDETLYPDKMLSLFITGIASSTNTASSPSPIHCSLSASVHARTIRNLSRGEHLSTSRAGVSTPYPLKVSST